MFVCFFPLADKDEIYVDVGCYSGYTIKNFVKFCNGKYKKIFGFEPDTISFERTLKDISDSNIANVKLLQKGAWSADGKLSFHNLGSGMSNVSDSGIHQYNV